jgi:ABC-type transport system involved in cytochrome bd biosynthesis fused ATPase/permease subunit
MSCADYKRLGNYFHIMMPTKKEEVSVITFQPPPIEMYTKDTKEESKNMEDAKMQNQTFSTQMNADYKYGMNDKK